MKTQLGYAQLSFKREIADAMIVKYIAQIASQSDIKEIEQLDAKPDKSRKSQMDTKSDQAIKESVVDQLYLSQLNSEKSNSITAKPADGSSKGASPADKEETSTKVFPLIPKDIPDSVKQSLIKFEESHQGVTVNSEDIDEIINSANVKDEKEKDQIKKRLTLYNGGVKEKKGEVAGLLTRLDIMKNVKMEDKAGKYSVKMSFKSEMPQLVKLLYNLQNSARWVKVDGMQISVADRNRALLAVELSMTATALYE
jgi:predicted transcriptional regulator